MHSAPARYNTTENNSINSHAQDTITLYIKIYLLVIHRWDWTYKYERVIFLCIISPFPLPRPVPRLKAFSWNDNRIFQPQNLHGSRAIFCNRKYITYTNDILVYRMFKKKIADILLRTLLSRKRKQFWRLDIHTFTATVRLWVTSVAYWDFQQRKSIVRPFSLTFWRRNYFFLILAHPVHKMWIIQEPNMLELWNKLHFEERKKRRVYTMFKIFGTCISWINI